MTQFVYHQGLSDQDLAIDRSTTIWRYQDLPKLLWTLATGCLWFGRIDTLGDLYEGSITRAGQLKRAEMINTMPSVGEPGGFRAHELEAWMSNINRTMVRNAAANCWHMGNHESAAMWKLYVDAGQGVAIRSTIDRLIRSFPEGTDSHIRNEPPQIRPRADTTNRDSRGVSNVLAVRFGPVVYADYHADEALDAVSVARDSSHVGSAFFVKRKSFEHEQEFRALIFTIPVTSEGRADLNTPAFAEGGVAAPVNLDTLIEAIHVSPGAPHWFRDVVEASVERFDRTISVVQSSLDLDPIY